MLLPPSNPCPLLRLCLKLLPLLLLILVDQKVRFLLFNSHEFSPHYAETVTKIIRRFELGENLVAALQPQGRPSTGGALKTEHLKFIQNWIREQNAVKGFTLPVTLERMSVPLFVYILLGAHPEVGSPD